MGKRRVIDTTLRCTGILSGSFTTIQAVIWLILTSVGFICFFVNTGEGRTAMAFREVYMNLSSEYSPSVVVKPIGFMVVVILYFLISALWLFTSVNLISVYNNGNCMKAIKNSSKLWMTTTLIICLVDLIIFIVFFVDFDKIGRHDKSKTRATDLNIIVVRKFNEDFKKLMNQKYLDEAKARIVEIYKKKYNITNSPKSKQGYSPHKRRRKRTITDILESSYHLGKYIGQTGWNTTAWLYSWLPTLPIPNFIRELIGNPFQPLLDIIHSLLFGTYLPHHEEQAVVIPDVALFNPKMPPAVLMGIAVRGIIVWISNCGLLILMYCLLKQLKTDKIFGCFFNWCEIRSRRNRSAMC